MSDSFRTRLRRGDLLVGTIVGLDAPEVIEILVGAGFDWLFLDAEHAPASPQNLQRLIIAAGSTPCLVRLPTQDEIWVKRALDSGAAGIIVPQVNTAAQAANIVRYAKYPPEGARGIGIARALGYGYEVADYIGRANAETVVMVQAEHLEAVRNIEAIAAVPGIDGFFVGPYDLSASMGKTGQVADPEVVAAIDTVSRAGKARSLSLGIFGVSPESVAPRIAAGYTLVACGVDTMLLGNGARAVAQALKPAR
ncbi:MAG: 2,4-dihydroxyhept-2-ene-1,7-dioic acid aldolase [Gammaproteobacteria bacterium]|nr:2,4-dihydroxyhept-2-ene-1,7-dioic acid aldolase [Gammaproteobacteria bacterium]MBI5618661.1 2,4-dihydroxyhept-2-ene-1,7-dioic acid aldolase [Gammaproteobacteria bacterium]